MVARMVLRVACLTLVSTCSAGAAKGRGNAMQPKKATVSSESSAMLSTETTTGDIMLASSISTAFADMMMHPIDTVKTVQQAEGLSLLAAIKKVGAGGKIAPFYDGCGVYAISDGIGGAIKFATYEKCKIWCSKHMSEDNVVAANFVSAAIAFLACSVVLVPGELIKQRLQAGVYPSLLVGVKKLLTEEGPRGMYRGYGATCLRDIPYTMFELGLYDLFKTVVLRARGKQRSDTSDELVAAAITGGLTGLLTNPFDVVKTQLMVTSTHASPWAAGKALVAKGGPQSLLVGSIARVAWLMPFTTIYYGCYEVAKRSLVEIRNSKQALQLQAAGGKNKRR